jgi:type I restriction enzyme S subunit
MLKDPLLGAVSPVYLVLRPRAAYRWFLEFSLERASTKQWINTLASGSVRQSLSYIDFSSIPCVVPPEPVIQRFNSLWSCLLDGILSRSDESHTLAAIRDTLLPKLISGELRIQNAERFISEVIT